MAAYLVIETNALTNPGGLSEYMQEVPKLIDKYGGKYLAKGPVTVLEGDHKPLMLILLEFESAEQMQALYDSDEYAPYKAQRQSCASSNFLSVEGV